jgi:hypothetical protein
VAVAWLAASLALYALGKPEYVATGLAAWAVAVVVVGLVVIAAIAWAVQIGTRNGRDV